MKTDRVTEFLKENQREIVLLTGVILISLLSFAAGFITAERLAADPLIIEENYR